MNEDASGKAESKQFVSATGKGERRERRMQEEKQKKQQNTKQYLVIVTWKGKKCNK